MIINKFKKIVIKIGSSSIVNDHDGSIKKRWLNSICKDISYLTKKNIEVGIHYPKMVINLKPYKKNINKKEFKNCLKYESLILSLPIHPFLTYKEIFFICKNINNFFKK